MIHRIRTAPSGIMLVTHPPEKDHDDWFGWFSRPDERAIPPIEAAPTVTVLAMPADWRAQPFRPRSVFKAPAYYLERHAHSRPLYPAALRRFLWDFVGVSQQQMTGASAHLAIDLSTLRAQAEPQAREWRKVKSAPPPDVSVTSAIVGALHIDRSNVTGELYACGTWVAAPCRRRGIGRALWRHALAVHGEMIKVDTASRGGSALIESLERAGLPVRHNR